MKDNNASTKLFDSGYISFDRLFICKLEKANGIK